MKKKNPSKFKFINQTILVSNIFFSRFTNREQKIIKIEPNKDRISTRLQGYGECKVIKIHV